MRATRRKIHVQHDSARVELIGERYERVETDARTANFLVLQVSELMLRLIQMDLRKIEDIPAPDLLHLICFHISRHGADIALADRHRDSAKEGCRGLGPVK